MYNLLPAILLLILWSINFLWKKEKILFTASINILIIIPLIIAECDHGYVIGIITLLIGYSIAILIYNFLKKNSISSNILRIIFKIIWLGVSLSFSFFLYPNLFLLKLLTNFRSNYTIILCLASLTFFLLYFLRKNKSLYHYVQVKSGLRTFMLYFINGISEEILFRGIMFSYFLSNFSSHLAILISSILFAISHYRAGEPSGIKGSVYTFFLGGIACFFIIISNSIYPAIILHGLLIPYIYLYWCNLHIDYSRDKKTRLYIYNINNMKILADSKRRIIYKLDPISLLILNNYLLPEDQIISKLSSQISPSRIRTILKKLKRLELLGGKIFHEKEYNLVNIDQNIKKNLSLNWR